MRIIINIDAVRHGKKRMRIRTKYQRNEKDGRANIAVGNAMIELYQQLVGMLHEGVDREIADFEDEGERL